LKEIRQISLGLSVPELDHATLAETIRETVRAHEGYAERRVRQSIAHLPARVDPEIKLAAYRFLQEGLNNASRHASGAAVEVRAGTAPDGSISLEIADEGPGFDITDMQRSDRLGLLGMRERLEALGGSLEIVSAKGKGTRLAARLPFTLGGTDA
jgi:signal transduction histidine kinase